MSLRHFCISPSVREPVLLTSRIITAASVLLASLGQHVTLRLMVSASVRSES